MLVLYILKLSCSSFPTWRYRCCYTLTMCQEEWQFYNSRFSLSPLREFLCWYCWRYFLQYLFSLPFRIVSPIEPLILAPLPLPQISLLKNLKTLIRSPNKKTANTIEKIKKNSFIRNYLHKHNRISLFLIDGLLLCS